MWLGSRQEMQLQVICIPFQVRALSNVVASSTQPIQNLRVLQHIGDKQQQQEWARKWITDGLTGSLALYSNTMKLYSTQSICI